MTKTCGKLVRDWQLRLTKIWGLHSLSALPGVATRNNSPLLHFKFYRACIRVYTPNASTKEQEGKEWRR